MENRQPDNHITIYMRACSRNEAFARLAIAAFVADLDPTVSELTDIKTAVSEAVTNAIIHGYAEAEGEVCLSLSLTGRTVTVEVSDKGAGIADIEQAMSPLFTSKPEMERSGMGFTVMEAFMDTLEVNSAQNAGTTVRMTKTIKG